MEVEDKFNNPSFDISDCSLVSMESLIFFSPTVDVEVSK